MHHKIYQLYFRVQIIHGWSLTEKIRLQLLALPARIWWIIQGKSPKTSLIKRKLTQSLRFQRHGLNPSWSSHRNRLILFRPPNPLILKNPLNRKRSRRYFPLLTNYKRSKHYKCGIPASFRIRINILKFSSRSARPHNSPSRRHQIFSPSRKRIRRCLRYFMLHAYYWRWRHSKCR